MCTGGPIESCIWLWSIERRHFQWPWTTPTPVSRSRYSLTLNISETVRDVQAQFQWNTNRDLHTPYSTVSFRMTLSDLEWLSKIFDDTKHRAASLQQQSFLLLNLLLWSSNNWNDAHCVTLSKFDLVILILKWKLTDFDNFWYN